MFKILIFSVLITFIKSDNIKNKGMEKSKLYLDLFLKLASFLDHSNLDNHWNLFKSKYGKNYTVKNEFKR